MNILQSHIARLALSATFLMAGTGVSVGQTSNIRYGKLPNGLSYYITNEGGTPGSVNYYIYQNVGAILENDKQDGLAHVLEHLAFNTTEHFPNGVMTFLRSHGLNAFSAYTGVDETRYTVSDVPATDKALNDQMLNLLYDWCHGVKITPQDVEKERAIVIEEWRQRNSVDRRMTDFIAPAIYNNAKYAHRNVIGTEEQLRTFNAKAVKQFYDTWYRPSLQYIAIVGDIDPAAVEAEVKARFSKLKAKAVPDVTHVRQIADNATPVYTRFVDKENQSPSFGLYQRKSTARLATKGGSTDQHIFTQIFNQLAPRRFAMLRNAGKENFIAASVSLSTLVRDQVQVAWDVVPYGGQEQQALQQLIDVREDLRKNGFTQSEFDEVRWNMYQNIKQLVSSGEGLGTPDNLNDLFRRHFLYGDSIMPFREQLNTTMQQLMELDARDMNTWLQEWMDNDNLAFVTYSKTAGEMNISQDQLLAALKSPSIERLDISTAQSVPEGSLLAQAPSAKKILSAKPIKELEATLWTLPNGARVFYKHVADKSGRAYFAGSAAGGKASVAAADLPSYTAMKALVMQSGVDRYNRNDLYQWVKDKDFELTISLGDDQDGIGGSTAIKDADAFFSYLNLVMSKQRFDQDIFRKYVERSKYVYETQNHTGMEAVQDSIQNLLYPPTALNPLQDTHFYDNMKYEQMQPLFDRYFGNAGEFTFCLVGDLEEGEARRLVETYIATLPGTPGATPKKVQDIDFSSKQQHISRTFEADIDGDMGEVEMTYLNNAKLDDREKAALEVFRGILENRYFATLRERDHATYSVGVKADYTDHPQPSTVMSIHFSTGRDKAEPLRDEALNILKQIAGGDFTDDEFKAVQVPRAIDEMQQDKEADMPSDPMLWMGMLNLYAQQGKVPETTDNEPAAVFKNLTREDVKAVAAKILANARTRSFVVRSLPLHKQNWEK